MAPGSPYFQTEAGEAWTPIGQNDAITWPELAGLFRRRDLAGVERHLAGLAASGVTCLRLMLEYSQVRYRSLERPPGTFVPGMVQLWDDLFALCARHGLRVLLTPFDTFWMWRRWKHHPYNRANGGICRRRSQWLTCRETRAAIKARLAFATERWGASGVIFGWDLWNEIHPAHAGGDAGVFGEFIDDLSGDLRRREIALHGRSHPQTVSIFGPLLLERPETAEALFRHPALDFHSSHFYEEGTIDDPRDTVAPAVSVGRLVRQALAEVRPTAPSSTASTARSTPSRTTAAPCPSRSTTSTSATSSGPISPPARRAAACVGRTASPTLSPRGCAPPRRRSPASRR